MREKKIKIKIKIKNKNKKLSIFFFFFFSMDWKGCCFRPLQCTSVLVGVTTYRNYTVQQSINLCCIYKHPSIITSFNPCKYHSIHAYYNPYFDVSLTKKTTDQKKRSTQSRTGFVILYSECSIDWHYKILSKITLSICMVEKLHSINVQEYWYHYLSCLRRLEIFLDSKNVSNA